MCWVSCLSLLYGLYSSTCAGPRPHWVAAWPIILEALFGVSLGGPLCRAHSEAPADHYPDDLTPGDPSSALLSVSDSLALGIGVPFSLLDQGWVKERFSLTRKGGSEEVDSQVKGRKSKHFKIQI